MVLGILKDKMPVYPIFYLLKGTILLKTGHLGVM